MEDSRLLQQALLVGRGGGSHSADAVEQGRLVVQLLLGCLVVVLVVVVVVC